MKDSQRPPVGGRTVLYLRIGIQNHFRFKQLINTLGPNLQFQGEKKIYDPA